jgi:hypothetical protein
VVGNLNHDYISDKQRTCKINNCKGGENEMKKFNITRVVTKNIVTDSFQGLRNLFGMRLRGYEGMITKNIDEITKIAEDQYDINWYRLSINPLTNGSAMITIYGEANDDE